MNEKSLDELVGRIAVDSQGHTLGEFETTSNNMIVVVRGLTTIERAMIPGTDISSSNRDSVIVIKSEMDYEWKDIGVKCENCGGYSKKSVLGFGHYFCSNKCRDQLMAKFSKMNTKRTPDKKREV